MALPADAGCAARLLALDPVLGGVWLRGPAGPAREAWLAALRAALPPGTPWRRVPPGTDASRLAGGLDLGASLAAGRPVQAPGLIAEAAGGVLLLPMAERASPALAGRLAAAVDAGVRVVACDESQGPDEALPPVLAERLALVVVLGGVPGEAGVLGVPGVSGEACGDGAAVGACRPEHGNTMALKPPPAGAAQPPPAAAGEALAELRGRLARLPFDAEAAQALAATAQALGLGASMRPAWQAWRVACGLAACAGRPRVGQDEAEAAARLVLASRARALPQADAAPPAPPDEPADGAPAQAAADETQAEAGRDAPTANPADDAASPTRVPSPAAAPPPACEAATDGATNATINDTTSAATNGADEHPAPPSPPSGASADRLLAAARAAVPPDLLALLAGGGQPRRAAGQGRQGAGREGTHGRRAGARRGLPRGGLRLDFVATLRAAVPWQALRRRTRADAGLPPAPGRLLVARGDVHVQRRIAPQPTTTVFVVDASGSQALHRLAEAKGAVERLLADCYVRRDRVALIAFRGEGAATLLPPTRSLVRARRALTDLPGGGGTPLAHGIDAAAALALQLQARGEGRAQLVFLTDARANIDRRGRPGREPAQHDALAAARRLAGAGVPSLVIDTSPRPQPDARRLADAMAGRCVALPLASSSVVAAAVRAMDAAQRG